jgi:general secretion pathway protein A
MYNRFFGLRSNPFGMTPDPNCLFLTVQHREAFAGLTYTIVSRRGFGSLTGDAGTGKTTLLAKVLASLPKEKIQSSIIFHPTLTTNDFLELVLIDFGIENVPATKAQRLARLQSFLLESHHAGRICTLIIDEAHKLSRNLLEEVRLLGNFDYAGQKLLQILLVGQTELDEILNRQDLRQLKQRIAVRLHIKALDAGELKSYIRYRWLKAGGSEPIPFSAEAIEDIARFSRGLPRVVNALCDNALLVAFAEQVQCVQVSHVQHSAEDLRLVPGTPGVEESAVTQSDKATAAALKEATAGSKSDHTPPARPAPTGQDNMTVPGEVPSPVRIPEFALADSRPSLLSRWAGKLRIGSI